MECKLNVNVVAAGNAALGMSIINLTIVECKSHSTISSLISSADNKSNHSGM